MSNTSLSISLGLESRSLGDLLFLEQIDYEPYTGKLTKLGMVQGVLGFLYPETGFDIEDSCGGADGIFDTIVYAYLYDQTLEYNFGLSWGSYSKRGIDDTQYSELLQAGLKDDVRFSYPNEGLIEAEWVGPVYNKYGEIIEKPSYTADVWGITFSSSVYGTLRVTYRVIRHRYGVMIESREHDNAGITENKYSSTAYANWNGGVKWVEVEAPHGFEEWDGQCGNGTIVIIDPPEDPQDPPKASQENKTTTIEYCSQEVQTYA